MLGKLVRNAWESLCLHGRPWTMPAKDYLEFRAAHEGVDLTHYVQTHNVQLEPFRIDRIAPLWLGMGWAYNAFSKKARAYDAVVDFREYPGEQAFFGLVREYLISATGVRIRSKCSRCAEFPEPSQKPDGMV